MPTDTTTIADTPAPATTSPTSTSTYPDFTKYKTLSFDCYGTLIDWERGISQFLSLIIHDTPESPAPTLASLLSEYCTIEHALEVANPTLKYRSIVQRAYQAIAAAHGITLTDTQALGFACFIGRWGSFPDTYASLAKLKHMGYKLAILSNVDDLTISETIVNNWDVSPFSAVFTAEQIGSYKPDTRNFTYLLEHAPGLEGETEEERKRGLLHVAQSRLHDHGPCKAMGIDSVWINRADAVMGVEKEAGDEGRFGYVAEFATLEAFVEEVARQRGWEMPQSEAEKEWRGEMEKFKDVPRYRIEIPDEEIERAVREEGEKGENKGWVDVGVVQTKRVVEGMEIDEKSGRLKFYDHEEEQCDAGREYDYDILRDEEGYVDTGKPKGEEVAEEKK
ncbi:HAD-like protein [Ascobolus immersus RN42]|uniref:HAD-like protein n=1 Tax=Ascobolus immersus RN42 TaxID=1160509 RepID=A0A3N4IFA4_ASCIM|nr:HAD-like protein [Ascobolus immersus RN42]